MKKTFLMSLMLLASLLTFAQQAVITFKTTEHDFGQIKEEDGRVTTVFEFKNEGMEPLVLSNVRASCGCTTPSWTRTPIEPGQTGTVSVTYNPNGRPGRFQKTVTITSNATNPTTKLYIKGEVIPKAAKPVNKYPVKMGDLSLSKKEVQFGNVLNTATGTKTIEYANLTDHEVTVAVLTNDQDAFLSPVLTLTKIAPQQSGTLSIVFDGKLCKEYGSLTRSLYIVVNGKRVMSDDYKITLHANLKEDFSQLTAEQRQQAPIIEITRQIDLGTLKAGQKSAYKYTLKNAGVNPLIIRKITCRNVQNLTANPAKGSVKGGKTTTLNITLDTTNLKAGAYTKQIELITNDPNNSRILLTVSWVVE